ncbi:hypothetical protein SAMN02746098_00382 [Desulfosporosinus lacus DSM 15449]|uniref:Uncharacterized protein n=1 Tax=Desulfosporosinus lacus DSM 15449 TaxID=1121420 RepID=A0A1M5QVW1_9FIRM|nr:hypothetical protein SAMN02746098_00382 [Desulfosporosinus lacus DSM 15449]
MIGKNSLELFNLDIEKIISGEIIVSSECQDGDEEYKELLLLAQLLAKADYAQKGQDRAKKILEKAVPSSHVYDELEDDELDMVAAGVNLDLMSVEYEKKD